MKNVLSKLKKARKTIQDLKLKKSGKNKHLGFNYYELSDILPTVNEVFDSFGLLGNFSIYGDAQFGNAKLAIYDTETGEHIDFETPIAQATLVKATPVQELGAVHTYVKRYLYLNALELVEPDTLDKGLGDDKVIKGEETKASIAQVNMIKRLLKDDEHIIQKACETLNVKELSEITTKQASDFIKRIQEKAKNG